MKDVFKEILAKKRVMSDKEIALDLIKTYKRYRPDYPWSINDYISIYVQITKIVKSLTFEEIKETIDNEIIDEDNL